MKQRYFIELGFNGKSFHGWQFQPNANSVQEYLEDTFSTIIREQISITGAGRTDAGVHASYFVAHFDSDKSLHEDHIYKINNFLNDNVVVYRIIKVDSKAHARFDAISRTYKYYVHLQKDPFLNDTSLYINRNLDVDIMNEACKVLLDYKDFSSFSKLHTDVKMNVCNIFKANWELSNNRIVFTIQANRFLRNMVRAIVGTMLKIGEGKIKVDDFRKIIESKNRSEAGPSAKAHGLFLTDIKYPKELFI